MSNEKMTPNEVFEQVANNVRGGVGPKKGLRCLNGNIEFMTIDDLYYQAKLGHITRAPRTITVEGVGVPEPIRCPLNKAKRYFFVNSRGRTQGDIWLESKTDYMRLNFGNVFYSREEAKARAEAEQRLFGINEDS